MRTSGAVTDGLPRVGAAAGDRGDQWLLRAATLFVVAVLVHNSDHLRRGTNLLRPDLFWLGTAGVVLEVAIVVLICQRHRDAPLVAAFGGIVLAAGYIEAHFLPAHEWFSDSFTSAVHVSPLSWFAASFEVVGAATLALVGLTVLRRRGGLRSVREPHVGEQTVGRALAHPLALVFTVCQVLVLAVSFAQRFG